jgi:hypothetical protein
MLLSMHLPPGVNGNDPPFIWAALNLLVLFVKFVPHYNSAQACILPKEVLCGG